MYTYTSRMADSTPSELIVYWPLPGPSAVISRPPSTFSMSTPFGGSAMSGLQHGLKAPKYEKVASSSSAPFSSRIRTVTDLVSPSASNVNEPGETSTRASGNVTVTVADPVALPLACSDTVVVPSPVDSTDALGWPLIRPPAPRPSAGTLRCPNCVGTFSGPSTSFTDGTAGSRRPVSLARRATSDGRAVPGPPSSPAAAHGAER